MGVIPNITHEKFPQQSEYVGKKVELCFHYNTLEKVIATVVRDDKEEPGETIFLTLDGRIILSTECHWTLPKKELRPATFLRFKPYRNGK